MSTIQDITHADMVSKLAKSGDEILKTLTPEKCHCLHMILGISGEAGELLDQIKKHVIYGKKLDRENIIEELGDLEFYIQGLRDGLKIRRNDTIKANIDKLSIRYQGFNYTDEAAIARADKKDQQVNNEELRDAIALEVAKWDQPAIRTSKDLVYWPSARWYQLADNIRALLTRLRPAAKEER